MGPASFARRTHAPDAPPVAAPGPIMPGLGPSARRGAPREIPAERRWKRRFSDSRPPVVGV